MLQLVLQKILPKKQHYVQGAAQKYCPRNDITFKVLSSTMLQLVLHKNTAEEKTLRSRFYRHAECVKMKNYI